MSIFAPVIGNLPLLNLHPKKLAKITGEPEWDCVKQIRQNCIRQAWVSSAKSGENLRTLLDIAMGRAHISWAELRGHEPGMFLDENMECARRENEIWTCFGFFLEAEVKSLIEESRPGPVLKSMLPRDMAWKESYACKYVVELKDHLGDYRRSVREDKLAGETARIVQCVTGRHSCIEGLPLSINKYFWIGELILQVPKHIIPLESTNALPASSE